MRLSRCERGGVLPRVRRGRCLIVGWLVGRASFLLVGLTYDQIVQWPACIAQCLVVLAAISGAPAASGLFAVRGIWRRRAKIARWKTKVPLNAMLGLR